MTTVRSVSFDSDGDTCAGDLYLPDASSPPVVTMAHGFGAERSFRLPAYAERFVDQGIAVFSFDYRGFGDSTGDDQRVDPFRHRQDWLAAVDAVRTFDAVDGSRLGLWGTSFSGGHVVETAARREVAAVAAQVPFLDGPATIRHLSKHSGTGRRYPLVATTHGIRDAVRGLFRQEPHTVPIVGDPDGFAMLNTPGASEGYRSLIPADSTWENACPARIALQVPRYRPIQQAEAVNCPVLLCIAVDDQIAPASIAESFARRLDHVEVLRLAGGHFDPYRGDLFERVVSQQTGFFTRHLQ